MIRRALKAATIALPIPTSIESDTTVVAAPWDNISFSKSTSEQAVPKVGVLLLNLGGPETGDDVEGMLLLLLLKIEEIVLSVVESLWWVYS